jgi:hypothetical protein
MIRILSKILSDDAALECLSYDQLCSSMVTVTALIRLLNGFVVYEDSVRVGQTPGPQLKGVASTKLYERSKDRMREFLVRAWILQYVLLKEATVQAGNLFNHASDDLANYLGTVHRSLGIRGYCKHANKAFVKLVKTELSTLVTEQDHTGDMAQVYYDLYGLRFATAIGDEDHGCPSESMDKKTAWSLIPTIMRHADRLNVKDLAKNELKNTIDKIQAVVGTIKIANVPALSYNKRMINAYLKSPIIADDLYRSIRGMCDLPTRPVHAETQIAAAHGWYFLLGHMTLTKFKSIKRVSPTPTDDLDTAATFFRQDLDHGIEKWETWFRLAQVYEAKIEDDLIWNSTKLNDSRGDIALLERQAIHCYMIATSMATQFADDSPETLQKVQEMIAEFATRLYASSRPPLSMEAFKTDKSVRFMSSTVDGTMSKQPFRQPIGEYALWNFAAHLLSRKFTDKLKPWTTHYIRGKCLWKMFCSPENAYRRRRVTAEEVLEAFTWAIEVLPKKEKSNDPILEPHFKLVSVVHKMVMRHDISQSQAVEYLQATRYAQNVRWDDDEDESDWVSYMLAILKKIGHADKSNWHHRIIDRAAHVIYDDSPNIAGALGAKHEFTQQIFTKTMTIQVWKPEHERPGRHYVYTGRYVSFFVHVLEQLQDRANLDALVRRIRRKTTDFLDHTRVWEEVVTAYVRLLRRIGQISEGRERALFDGMNHDEYTKNSERVQTWALDPDATSVPLDILREAIDLKRLNNSLMKGPVIDDLIGDAYACMYEQFVKQLPAEEQPQPQPGALPQGTLINTTTDTPGTGEGVVEGAKLDDMTRAQGDGVANGSIALSVSTAVGLGLQGSMVPFVGATAQPVSEVIRVPGKPGRTKTVTRREIQRKAEAAIAKPPPIKTPILSKRPVVEIFSKSEHPSSPVDKRFGEMKDEDMDDSRANSRRNSVQDSADNEADGEDSGSDLSDMDNVDEDNKQRLLNLEENGEGGDEDDGDGDGDDEDDVASEEGNDGSENAVTHEQEDEDMVDAQEEVEIQDSQKSVDGGGAAGEEDEQEFHEARENDTED